MERAHRIGQTKPVRVYRLVVKASVEERMASRAHKKLFLNEMVAEKDGVDPVSAASASASGKRGKGALEDLADDGEGDDLEEQAEGGEAGEDPVAEMDHVGSSKALAKDEVVRMIRTGVTALFEANRGELGEEELDVLLGRKEASAAAAALAEAASGEGAGAGAGAGGGGAESSEAEQEKAVDGFWKQASELAFEEVSMRELEGVAYAKAKTDDAAVAVGGGGAGAAASVAASAEELPVELGTRKRKQRLVMVDGKGTGYGGAVPVLAEDWERHQREEAGVDEAAETERAGGPKRARREWEHEACCFICHEPMRAEEEEEEEEEAEGEAAAALEGAAEEKEGREDEKGGSKKGGGKKGGGKKEAKKGGKGSKKEQEAAAAAAAAAEAAEQATEQAAAAAEAEKAKAPKDFKCGFCPRTYHPDCLAAFLEEHQLELGNSLPNVQICLQHNCCGCRRSTSAAGGLLFRCVDCPRAFCEDCLEEDEIESIGRWRPLEALGYFSKKQGAWACPPCLPTCLPTCLPAWRAWLRVVWLSVACTESSPLL